MRTAKPEMRMIYCVILLLFAAFLLLPLIILFVRSFVTDQGVGISNYVSSLSNEALMGAIGNSIKVSSATAVITTILAFTLAYAVNCTRILQPLKSAVKVGIIVPMLIPTITYGFAIMYTFGNQGLITKLFGQNLFEIYGFHGLLIGYVIYTLPAAFLLINNSFGYIDKKFIIVSKLMGDRTLKSFLNTVIRPLLGSLGGAFILSFILSFTDFGIPASVGGTYQVVAMELYQLMLGSIPDFNMGAVVAVLMLFPAVLGVFLLNYLEKFNFHYDKFSDTELAPNKFRDVFFGSVSIMILLAMFSVFAVMFIAPFVEGYPYDLTFTLNHVIGAYQSGDSVTVYKNSLIVAVITAVFGTIVAYGSAIINARTPIKGKQALDVFSMIINTVPGMVLGLSYLLFFNGSSLKGNFIIMIICNIVHYFTTPYLMAKNALTKMNPVWETSGELLGDNWFKTIYRVILPNSVSTVIEIFSYFFINAMVTISGIIFLVTAQTTVVASKINELQHFAKFNEIFVLSVLIFLTNLLMKTVCEFFQKSLATSKRGGGNRMFKSTRIIKKIILGMGLIILAGCSAQGGDKVVIYTNGDDEATSAIEEALDSSGYEDEYILQSLGTSELGGKLMAEGGQIEADLVTMSSYFLEGAQEEHAMFEDLTFKTNTLDDYPSYYAPILANTGSIFINKEVLKQKGLETPGKIGDLAKPEYEGLVSIPDIANSSTGWLMVQAVINEYGEGDGRQVLQNIIANAGPHLEKSGSGPISKIQTGEVAVGFGLRHQAIAAKESGSPIDFVDPVEGNFSLTESVAVVEKDGEKSKLAMEMAEVIIKDAREALLTYYPVNLYEGETVEEKHKPAFPKNFGQPLNVDLLKKHQEFFRFAK